MATSWKVSWNVDPLALMVPLSTELSADVAPPAEGSPAGADEEHAATTRIVAATAPYSVAACCRCRSGISATPPDSKAAGLPGHRRLGAVAGWSKSRVAGVIIRPA